MAQASRLMRVSRLRMDSLVTVVDSTLLLETNSLALTLVERVEVAEVVVHVASKSSPAIYTRKEVSNTLEAVTKRVTSHEV